MKLKFDFMLSNSFGAVEKLIYRLVINGVSSADSIAALLPVFSDEVIALSIRKLVNAQLLNADVESRTVSLSDMSLLLIDSCAKKEFDIDILDEFDSKFSKSNENDCSELNAVILRKLLPGVKTSFLSSLIDFAVLRGESNE